MKKEYQKHIVSTKDHQVWLHRLYRGNLESALKNGPYASQSGDIRGIATTQPENLDEAEDLYKNGRAHGDIALVIKFPRNIIKELHEKGKRQEYYLYDKRLGYWNPEKTTFAVQKQHVHGYIDRETNEYYPNPYLKEPQQFTDKHFPQEVYGGLERDLIQEQKPAEKIKPKKQKKLKKGELPPPPEEIVIP